MIYVHTHTYIAKVKTSIKNYTIVVKVPRDDTAQIYPDTSSALRIIDNFSSTDNVTL